MLNKKIMPTDNLCTWNKLQGRIQKKTFELSQLNSYQFLNSPISMVWSLSHYKFASRMIKEKAKILDVGCNGGLGTRLLVENSRYVCGLDADLQAIKSAQKNFANTKMRFIHSDIFNANLGKFDAVVIFSLINYIKKAALPAFYESIHRNLKPDGICFIGAPNETAAVYSREGKVGLVNNYSWLRLKAEMERYFKWVFLFSSNDEVIHTGFYPLAHRFIAMGICKKHSKRKG